MASKACRPTDLVPGQQRRAVRAGGRREAALELGVVPGGVNNALELRKQARELFVACTRRKRDERVTRVFVRATLTFVPNPVNDATSPTYTAKAVDSSNADCSASFQRLPSSGVALLSFRQTYHDLVFLGTGTPAEEYWGWRRRSLDGMPGRGKVNRRIQSLGIDSPSLSWELDAGRVPHGPDFPLRSHRESLRQQVSRQTVLAVKSRAGGELPRQEDHAPANGGFTGFIVVCLLSDFQVFGGSPQRTANQSR